MAMDTRKRLPHQPRKAAAADSDASGVSEVQELAAAAQEVWEAHTDSPGNAARCNASIDKLGAALSLFALGPLVDAAAGQGPERAAPKNDPRHAPPAANVRVNLP